MLIVWTLGDDSISMGWIRFLRMAKDPNATSSRERNVLMVLLSPWALALWPCHR